MIATMGRVKGILVAVLLASAPVGAMETSDTLTIKPSAEAMALLTDAEKPLSARLATVRDLAHANQQDPEVWTAYGELLEETGDDAAALMAFERACAMQPPLFTPWLRIGILQKRGVPEPDLGKAEAALRKALELGAPRARSLNELAVTVAMRGRITESRDLWLEAQREDPAWGVLYNNLFKACLQIGDEKTVNALLPQALSAERFSEAPILQLGDFYERKKRPAEAEALYRRALELHPLEPRFHMALGMNLAAGGNKDGAAECFQSARRLGKARDDDKAIVQSADWELFKLDFPRDEQKFQALRALVFSQEPNPRILERNHRKAIKELEPLLEKHPTFWNGFFVRGVAYRRIDERGKAKADLLRVLELNPTEPNATMELALMARDNFEFGESATLAEKAMELAPRDPIFAVNAGFIMIEAGRCERAWELYGRALRMVGEQNCAPLREMLDVRCPSTQKESAP